MDVYRLEDGSEELGFDEYFEGNGVTVIEWAHIIQEQLPEERLTIELYMINGNRRKIVFTPFGRRYHQLCEEFFNEHFSN